MLNESVTFKDFGPRLKYENLDYPPIRDPLDQVQRDATNPHNRVEGLAVGALKDKITGHNKVSQLCCQGRNKFPTWGAKLRGAPKFTTKYYGG